ncbi:helix-turn-helix transcriptional regulator [Vibrio harveyi]|uniref:helix-turn-helix transcriptional regulator n=1 Tax=Vibrio harveyi TaxID=669 RepID=UPI0003A745B8|nr:response regulator transcription factor [Vibrio harveyi]EKY4195929.1 response regulator transcription factor [Vibrio harveyi]MBY7701091.1 response regulator transcription factor [Vibrio harveyi]PNM63328.1 helix-turn-helix transcriptional regulator [Vibrio harveyi]UIL55716.1 response regulator transcription factor [Vibrio harveyi]WJT08896.1 response regulator transcription factor [Vibrio harveyi]
MTRSQNVYVISSDSDWSGLVIAGLSHSFKNYTFYTEKTVNNIWNLKSTDIVIYDRLTLGNPSLHLISPLSRGGAWLLANASKQDLEGVQGLISLGWGGLLENDFTLELLHKSVRMVASGQLWFSREAMSSSLKNIVRGQVHSSSSAEVLGAKYELSTKEQKVFMYLVQGYSNKEIAGQLSVSLSTVKTHVSHILSKTGKQSRSQLGSLMVE